MNLPQTHCFFVLQISLTHDNGHLCRRSALQTLPLSAALLHEKVPLVSFLALRSLLKNTLIREMSIHARSCTLQADSGSQSVLFDESVQSDLMVLEASAGNNTLLLLPRWRNLPQKHWILFGGYP